jgi:hypothetical protein
MGGLEFLNPKGLWLLSGLVPLIVLYILKVKRQRMRVPSTWLWAAAHRDLMAKHPFRKLTAELPLILQILALIALAVALARPAARGGKISGDHVAIVVDTSASMGARSTLDGKPATRLQVAERAARDVVSALEPGADAIVIEAAREARVVSPLERDPRHLEAAISSLAVREVEGDLAPAVALAADRLRTLGGRTRIVLVTDGALAHGSALSAGDVEVQVITVGEPAENAGIVRIDVRAGTDPAHGAAHDQAQVFVMVQNYEARARDAFVTLTVEDRKEPAASRRMLLAPKEKTPVVLTFEPEVLDRGKGLIVKLSAPDGKPFDALGADDVAYGRVPSGYKMPVTLASRSTYSWIARALDADPSVDLQRITLDQLKTVNIDPEALLIVEGTCPEDPPGRDLVVFAPPTGRCHDMEVLAGVDQPQLTSWETGDPRFRFLTLDGVHVARATPIRAQGSNASLLRAGTSTLIADASIPGRTTTLVGFEVGDSDWPLKASFVLFMRNLVELSRLHRVQGAAGPVRTGDPLRVAVPAGVTSVNAEGPEMPDHELSAKGGFAVIPAVEHPGIYRVRWSSPRVGSVSLAANLTSDRESDITPQKVTIDTTKGKVTGAARNVDAHREWGVWLALLAALVLLFDLYWLTRRPHPQTRTQAVGARG